MKKLIFILMLLMVTTGLFAQQWLVGGDVTVNYISDTDKSGGTSKNDSWTTIGIDAYFGYYVMPDLAVGLLAGFRNYSYDRKLTGNTSGGTTIIKIGPMMEYDFLNVDFFSLGVFGSLTYWHYSYKNSDITDSSVNLNAALHLNFQLTPTFEVYAGFLPLSFKYYWYEIDIGGGYKYEFSQTTFSIDPYYVKMGVKFKF